MNIIIQNLNASNTVLEINALFLKQMQRKTMKLCILFYTLGTFMFVMGMTNFSSYSETTIMDKTVYYTNWHLIESFGLVIILITTYLLILSFRNKSKHEKKSKALAEKYLKGGNKTTHNITGDCIIYQSPHLSYEISWKNFTGYTILEHYLLLFTEEGVFSAVTIHKNLMPSEDFSILLGFVKSKLPQTARI